MQGRENHRAWDLVGSNGGQGGEGVTRGLKIGILSLGRRNKTTARMNNERAVYNALAVIKWIAYF